MPSFNPARKIFSIGEEISLIPARSKIIQNHEAAVEIFILRCYTQEDCALPRQNTRKAVIE